MTTQLLERTLTVRSLDTATREFTGLAVPYDTPTRIRDWWMGDEYDESVARGAVQDSDDAKIFWQHREAIGKITSARDTTEGWEITGYLSDTTRGNEAYTLLRDGVLDRLSIGFEPIEHRTIAATPDAPAQIIRTKIRVREVSIVNFPAYEGAAITDVRHHTHPSEMEKHPMTVETVDRADTSPTSIEVLERLDDLERGLKSLSTPVEPSAPARTHRSAGQALKAIYDGDDDALAEYNEIRAAAHKDISEARAYTGSTLSDSIVKDSWVGDLTRLVEEADPLRDLFSTGVLPATGMKVEFGRLKSNTVAVGKQATEGTDLTKGKVQIEPASATIETFGGWTELSRQVIERSTVNFLDTTMRALALAAGKAQATARRAALAAAVSAQTTASNTVTVATNDYKGWFAAIVEAAGKYEDLGLPISATTIVADSATFTALGSLTDTAGRPLFNVFGDGANAIGEINLAAAPNDLNLAGVRLRLNTKQTAAGAAFTHPFAIRSYHSPVASLQDSNIVNLTQQASVYYYGAFADEMPAAIIPAVLPSGSGS